jgi:hypothetical protein
MPTIAHQSCLHTLNSRSDRRGQVTAPKRLTQVSTSVEHTVLMIQVIVPASPFNRFGCGWRGTAQVSACAHVGWAYHVAADRPAPVAVLDDRGLVSLPADRAGGAISNRPDRSRTALVAARMNTTATGSRIAVTTRMTSG